MMITQDQATHDRAGAANTMFFLEVDRQRPRTRADYAQGTAGAQKDPDLSTPLDQFVVEFVGDERW